MRFLISAQAVDKPGIVSVVSGAVAERGWSVEDASMTRLAGRFAMLLVICAEDADLNEVVDALMPKLEESRVTFQVEQVDDKNADPISGQKWTITVYGSDRPGIVAAVAGELAQWEVNIDDLSTHVTETEAGSTYTMLIDATTPVDIEGDVFQHRLADVGNGLGVTCHAAPVDVDVL